MVGVVGRLALTNHVQPTEWSYVVISFALFVAVAAALFFSGRARGRGFFDQTLGRFADSFERETGLPAWAGTGIAIGYWALLTAMIGFFWDVSWHIDLGRDRELFTPPHTLIVMGLLGILASGVASVVMATYERARTGWRLGRVVIPYSSLPLLFLGGGAVVGFPLDDLWHTIYGVDVTMWSPTHLTMIGGAVFSSFAFSLMLAEGLRGGRTLARWGRLMPRLTVGSIISALTAFELEFDLGVPQWQQLYHPVLIAAAAGIGFCAARAALGRGGAIRALVGFLVIRVGLFAWMGSMGHDMPHFPIYAGAAVGVEGAWYLTRGRSPYARALLAGLGVATIGLATEWAWSQVFGRQPWNSALLPGIWAAVVMAFAATAIGTAMGGVLAGRRAGLGTAAVVAAAIALVGMMLVPFPRHVAAVRAHLTTSVVPGSAHPVVDNSDRPSVEQMVNVAVTLTPADAAAGADWVRLSAWQGGGYSDTTMRETSPGHYVASAPVPAGGSWKTMLRIARHDEMIALPVSMPSDPSANAPAVPLQPARDAAFLPEQQVLMRETHNGATWPAQLAIAVELVFLVAWITSLALGYRAMSRTAPPPAARKSAVKRPKRRLTGATARA